MILNLASSDVDKFNQYKNAIIALDIKDLTVEATKKEYLAAYERIHHLVSCAKSLASTNSDQLRIQAVEEDIEQTIEISADRHAFYLSMDFFWAIERLAKISLKAIASEVSEFELVNIEVLHSWIYLVINKQLLPLDYYLKSEERNALSLGQQHSTSGVRRLTFFNAQEFKDILNQLLSSNISQDDFLSLYKSRDKSPVIELMRTENLEEKRQLFRSLIDQCKIDIRKISDFVQNAEHSNYFVWLEDPTLQERVGMVFEHEKETEAKPAQA